MLNRKRKITSYGLQWQFWLPKNLIANHGAETWEAFYQKLEFSSLSSIILSLTSKNHTLKGSGILADQILKLRPTGDQKYLPGLLHN